MKTRALLQARSLNRRIGNYLRQPRAGYILATFDRSSYLDMDGQIVALVTPVLLNGPLNIVVDAETFHDRVAAGDTATSTDRGLRAGGIEIELAGAIVWDAALPPWPGEQISRLRHNLVTLRGVLEAEAPEGGLARAATGHLATTALETRAAPALRDLARGLQRSDALLVSRAAGALAGLGPGLTPSGDDVLVGCLLTLALYPDTADLMRQAIVSGVRDRTTRISMAYLEAAARAEGSESWHRLVAALAPYHPASSAAASSKTSTPDGTGLAVDDPGRIAGAARGVMAFGETSGSDMLSGFALAAEALLESSQ